MRLSSLAPVFLLTWTAFGQAPDAVIRSSVREVLLDVVVRDAHGRLVNNLKPGEVTVYEDGVRQEVRSFRLVAGSEVRIEDQKQAAEALGSGAKLAGSSIARPPVNPLRTVNVVCLILNDLNPETRAFAFESARKFVNEELRPNTFIGVFSLDGRAVSSVLCKQFRIALFFFRCFFLAAAGARGGGKVGILVFGFPLFHHPQLDSAVFPCD